MKYLAILTLLLLGCSETKTDTKTSYNTNYKIESLEGKSASEIKSKYLNGEDFILSDLKGKIVVLDFWATWCPPCVKSMPDLLRIKTDFSQNEVSIITINQGESEDTISRFLKKMSFESLDVVLDKNQMIGKNYNVQGIPHTVVIDKNGVVRYSHVGFSPNLRKLLKNKIDSLLGR